MPRLASPADAAAGILVLVTSGMVGIVAGMGRARQHDSDGCGNGGAEQFDFHGDPHILLICIEIFLII